MDKQNVIVVFGGTGYLGKRIVKLLVEQGLQVRVAVRNPDTSLFKASEHAVELVRADVTDPESVRTAMEGCDGAVNSVGLYIEKGAITFQAVHVDGARNVARESAARGIRLIHVSGIGVDPDSPSSYVAARARGDDAVLEEDPNATLLRPSVLFGHGDPLLGSLVSMTRFLPVIPLFGSGSARMQPVHVDDVALAVSNCLSDEASRAKVFELGGPDVFSYRELLETVASHMDRKRLYLPIPFVFWNLIAALGSILPNPPLTRDQVALMQDDSIVGTGQKSFSELGITPAPLSESLPAKS